MCLLQTRTNHKGLTLAKLAQTGEHQTRTYEVLSSIITGSNFLLKILLFTVA